MRGGSSRAGWEGNAKAHVELDKSVETAESTQKFQLQKERVRICFDK